MKTPAAIAVLLSALVCAGCGSFGDPPRKASVMHSSLPPVSSPRAGVVVLREEVNSYRHQRTVIGGKVLDATDWVVLLIPTAWPKFLVEIEGGQSLNQVLAADLAETLTHVGYTVQVQKKPTKALPKKWREIPCILEFTIEEFNYEYGRREPKPNWHTITLDLRLLNQGSTGTLWQKRYHSVVKAGREPAEYTIRDALDEVLKQVLTDALTEDFQKMARSGCL
jgi:hypothetical protein